MTALILHPAIVGRRRISSLARGNVFALSQNFVDARWESKRSVLFVFENRDLIANFENRAIGARLGITHVSARSDVLGSEAVGMAGRLPPCQDERRGLRRKSNTLREFRKSFQQYVSLPELPVLHRIAQATSNA